MSEFGLDYEDALRLSEQVKAYPQEAERKITEYLHGAGYERISQSIQNAIPVSERPKKGRHARDANALVDKDKGSILSVTVGTRSKFNYLYFPDDGSNTIRHAGGQHFFKRGAEMEQEQVINGMLECLRFEQE